MKYEVKDVVGNYGICENGRLILGLMLNSKANALLIADILNEDSKHEIHPRAYYGHWIKKKIGYSTVFEKNIFQYVCSECGRQIGANGFKLENFPYCNCGAKMNEVIEDV